MQRFRHRTRAREREDVGNARLELAGHDGVVHRRPEGAHHGEDPVAVDQLVGRLDRAGHLVLIVLDDEADLAAVDAAFLVHGIEDHSRRVDAADTDGRGRTGQVGVGAEHDLPGRFRGLGIGAPASRQDGAKQHASDGEGTVSMGHACCPPYIESIRGRYFSFTNLRLSFIVGVSSSSSGVSSWSIRRNFFTCSTRANFALTAST